MNRCLAVAMYILCKIYVHTLSIIITVYRLSVYIYRANAYSVIFIL